MKIQNIFLIFLFFTTAVNADSSEGILYAYADIPPKTELNEQLAIPAGKSYIATYKAKRKVPINIQVAGLRNTAKGFSVYAMPKSQLKNFMKGKRFNHYAQFSRTNVTSFDSTIVFPKGEVAFAIKNANNLVNPINVHVVITTHPQN
ncbi:hypothetical protein ACMXYQ_05915 [Neptuniibacter sp. PT34_22]|uniref:hypothetical protein n=1 Tax=Neptuniibacter sp. PT34_22 TaxID=3398205 RepID=UPI0039F4DDAD